MIRHGPGPKNAKRAKSEGKALGRPSTLTIQIPDGPLGDYINRVFVRKNSIEIYGHDDDLLRIVGATHSKSFYDVFANSDVVPSPSPTAIMDACLSFPWR
jgi:hypothetical protein